jgi:PRTRC genetic system protein B
MDTTVQFGKADRTYTLKRAILIYQEGDRTDTTAATVHNIELDKWKPRLLPGEPITVAAIEGLMRDLGHKNNAAFLPPQVLSLGMDRMAWWCPAGRRRIWFKPSHDKDSATLKKLNSQFAHHPPLLFVADNGLSVYALAQDRRPEADTKVFFAPYWNLSGSDRNGGGHMCRGNIKLPRVATDNLAGFERAFFGSSFTHSSGGKLTRFPGGHNALWRELTTRKSPPDEKFWRKILVPTNTTVNQLCK